MNDSSLNNRTTCDELAAALVRAACDGGAARLVSGELRDHLDTCSACAEALDGYRDVAAALRDAWGPAPLDAALRERVLARSISRVGSAQPPLRVLRLAGVAAAACLFAAAFVSQGHRVTAQAGFAALTSDDAGAIFHAVAAAQWDSAAEYSVDSLSERLSELEKTLSAGGTSRSSADAYDDWDMPLDTAPRAGGQPT